MHSTDLRTLINYSYWARDLMLGACEQLTPAQFQKPMGNSFPSIRDTVVHLHWAECIWMARLADAPGAPPQPIAATTVAAIRAEWSAVEKQLRAYVSELSDDDVNKVLEYKTLAGAPIRTPIGQVITHLANHGTHHRGQVVTMLRQLGATPAKAMDLIYYYREKGSAA